MSQGDRDRKISDKINHIKMNIMEKGSREKDHVIMDLQQELSNLKKDNHEITKKHNDMEKSSEEWMGRAIRFNWIINEMKRVGAIRLPDHDWATDMTQAIEFPYTESPSKSIFRDGFPSSVRDRFIPSFQDSHFEFIDEEEESEIIAHLSREASEFSSGGGEGGGGGEGASLSLSEAVIIIQSHMRGYISRWKTTLIFGSSIEEQSIRLKSSIKIQKIWRGFCSRGTRFYKYEQTRFSGQRNMRQLGQAGGQNPFKKTIRFMNTGPTDYAYQWIRPNGSPTRAYIISRSKPGCVTVPVKMKTFVSHWFAIGLKGSHISETRFIRINLSMHDDNYFDVHTGLNFTPAQANARPLNMMPTNQRYINTNDNETHEYTMRCNCPICLPLSPLPISPLPYEEFENHHQQPTISDYHTDDGEGEEETSLQIAIQRSMQGLVWQSGIGFIRDRTVIIPYQSSSDDETVVDAGTAADAISQRNLIRQQQDQEYIEAEAVDLARETINGPVDEEDIRLARISRFDIALS